jgi:hypothetical protein
VRARLAAAVVLGTWVPGLALAADAGTPVPTVHVDASAAPGGDGSPGRPFRGLREAIGPGPLQIRLADGIYAGDVLLDGVELVGSGAAVVSAAVPATTLRTRGAVRMVRVQIQGGAVGLRVEAGRAELESVRFSGQRTTALEVAEGAVLSLSGSAFQASVSGVLGLRLLPGARATVRDTEFTGPFQRAVQAKQPAELRLEKVRTRDAVTALHLDGGEGWLMGLDAARGRGPAVFVAHGRLHVQQLSVTGHEYALLTGEGAEVDGADVRSTGAFRAALGIVQSRASLSRVTIEAAGDHGALSLLSSDVQLTDLTVTGGQFGGVSMHGGQLRLERARFSAIETSDRLAGDAVQVRTGRATLSSLDVQGCSGIGLLAAEGAVVDLTGGTVQGAGVAGLSVDTEGQLTATGVTVRDTRGPAVLALDGGKARLVRIQARANRDGGVWAECSKRASVEVEGWTGDVLPTPSECIRVRK